MIHSSKFIQRAAVASRLANTGASAGPKVFCSPATTAPAIAAVLSGSSNARLSSARRFSSAVRPARGSTIFDGRRLFASRARLLEEKIESGTLSSPSDMARKLSEAVLPRIPRPDVKKVLVVGSGGLSIGQAGEFDYSGEFLYTLRLGRRRDPGESTRTMAKYFDDHICTRPSFKEAMKRLYSLLVREG